MTIKVLLLCRKILVQHNASKHTDMRYHFFRDFVISGKMGLEKIPTVDIVTDEMTKCLNKSD